MTTLLKCDGCGREVLLPTNTYEEWEDYARKNGWWIGEDYILCPRCKRITIQ